MASKEEDFDLDDWGDIDANDLDFNVELSTPPIPTGRDAVLQTPVSAAKGALDAIAGPGKRRDLVLNALPKEYRVAADAYDNLASTGSDVYGHAKEEFRKTAQQMKYAGRSVLPMAKPFLPKSIIERLNKTFAADPTWNNEYDQNASTLAAGMDQVFGGDGGKAQAEGEAEEYVREKLEDKVKEVKQDRVYDVIGKIGRNIEEMTVANRIVGTSWKKKMLELNFRQYFTLTDILKSNVETGQRVTTSLEAIVKNTALPDYAKEEFGEITAAMMKRKVIDVLSPANFARNYFRVLGDNVRSKITDFFGGVSDVAGMVAMGGDMMAMEPGEELTPEQQRGKLMQTGARVAGGAFANKWIAPHIKKKQESLRSWAESHEEVANFGGRTANILTTLPERLNAYGNDPSHDGGEGAILTPLLRFLGGMGPTINRERVNFEGYDPESISKTVGWAKRDSVTLNEIIPGYLARIDRSVRGLTNPGAELETFDFKTRSFKSMRSLATRLNKEFGNERVKQYQRHDLDKVIDEIVGHDKSGMLEDGDREGLRKILESQALGVKAFDTRELAKNYDAYGNVESTNLMALFDSISKNRVGANALDAKVNTALGRVRSMTGRAQSDLDSASSLYGTDVLKMAKVLQEDEDGRNFFNRRAVDVWSDFDGMDAAPPQGGGAFGGPPRAAPPRAQRGGANQQGRFDAQTIKDGMRQAFWGVEPTLKDTIVAAIDLSRKRYEESRSERSALGAEKTDPNSIMSSILEQLKVMNVAPRIDDIIEAIHGVSTSNVDPEKLEEYFKGKKGKISSFFGGLWKQGKLRWRYARRVGKSLRKSAWDKISSMTGLGEEGAVRGLFTKTRDSITGAFGSIKDGLLGERNIYDDEGNIILSGRLLKLGKYYTKDGKQIKSIKDIEGGVYNESGEPIISEEEMMEKLTKLRYWSGKGWKFLSSTLPGGIADKARKGLSVANNIQKFIRSTTLDLGKSVYNQLTTGVDVYVKGQMETPRLHRTLMVKGWYVSETTGKPIRNGSDIDGPVITKHKEPVITAQELADPNFQLVDEKGRPLKTRWDGLKGKITDLVKMPINLIGKGARALGRGLSFGRDVGASIWESMFGEDNGKGKSGKSTGGVVRRFLNGQNAITDRLDSIYNLLDERIKPVRRRRTKGGGDNSAADSDGDGVRDGSFMDIFRRRRAASKAKEAEKDKDGNPVEKKEGIISKLLSAGGLLFTAGKTLATGFTAVVGTFFKNTLGVFLTGLMEKMGELKMLKTAGDALGSIDTGGFKEGAKDKVRGAKKYGSGIRGRIAGAARGAVEWGSGLLGRGGATAAAGAAGSAAASTGLFGTIGTGLAWAARGAVTIAAGALTSPWVLGATVAYVGYKLLKRKNASPLDSMRFAQYGSSEYGREDLDDAAMFRYLEESYGRYVAYDRSGIASVRGVSQEVSDEIARGAGLTAQTEEAVTEWNRWFHGRFLPVYMLWCTRLRQNAPEAKLTDLSNNDSVRYDVQERIANACTLDPNHPMFDIGVGPLPEGSTLLTGAEVDAVQQETIKSLSTMMKLSPRTESKDLVKDDADLSKTSKFSETGDSSVKAKQGWFANMISSLSESLGFDNEDKPKTAPGGVDVIGASIERNGRTVTGQVDALTAIRLRAYGLVEMKTYRIDQLYRLEDLLFKDIYRTSDRVEYKGKLESVIETSYRIFGIMRSNESARNEYEQWFKSRFFPVFLNYLTVFYKLVPNGDPFQYTLSQFSSEAFDIGSGIIATKTTLGGSSMPIWAVDFSPWKDQVKPTLAQVTELVNANMRYLDKIRKDKVIADQALAEQGKLAPKAVAKARPKQKSGRPEGMTQEQYDSSPQAMVDSIFQDLDHSANDSIYGGGSPKEFSGFDYSMGAMSEIGEGSGSYADLRKMPVGNKQDVVNMIMAAAKMTGMDPGLLLTVAQMESSLNIKAGANTSSAKGLYQFINSTWSEVMGKYGNAYGLPKNANVFDPWANTLMGAEYLKEGAKRIMSKLGRPATPVDLYMMHFLGGGGGSKFLTNMRNNPNAIAANDFAKQAVANEKVFFSNGRALTYAEVYDNLQRRARTGFSHVQQYAGNIGKINGDVSKPLSDINDEVKDMTLDSKAIPLATAEQETAAEQLKAKKAGTEAATKAAAFSTPMLNPGSGSVSAYAAANSAAEVAKSSQNSVAAAKAANTSVELAKVEARSINASSVDATLKAAQQRGAVQADSIGHQQLEVQRLIYDKLTEIHNLALARSSGNSQPARVSGSDVVAPSAGKQTYTPPRGIIPGK